MSTRSVSDAAALQHSVVSFVRAFGMHRPGETPCGKPISVSQAHALMELAQDDGLTQIELGTRLRLEKSTVSRLAADLEARDLLVRDRDPDNRRLYRLRITEHGRAEHARMGAGYHDQYMAMTAALTPAERDALLVGLPGLIRVIRESYRPETDQTAIDQTAIDQTEID